MDKIIIKYLLGILIFTFLDIIKIYYFRDIYIPVIENVQQNKIKINYYGAFISYLLINLFLIYIIYFNKSINEIIFLTFIIYGIYNFTNYATFINYNSFSYIFIDIITAIITMIITIYIIRYLFKKFEEKYI